MHLKPDHWRYRYAAKMSTIWPFIGMPFGALMIFALLTSNGVLAFVAVILLWPFVLPAANLGCHTCNYNIFLPYRGPEYPEHGDSWTHPDVERRLSRRLLVVPPNCPKCGAQILTNISVQPPS